MADALLYEQSLETQGGSEPFVSRQVVQVLDQNGGNYNGQIQIDTSSLSNSGKYASYGEAYLVIPIVTTLEATAAVTAANLTNFQANLNNSVIPFGAGLKCGSHQLIHSLSVSYNNSDVVQLTPYTNFYVQYKLMTQMSSVDVEKIGPSIGFWPDTSDSYTWYRESPLTTNANGRPGTGVLNNRNGYAPNTALGSYSGYLTTNTCNKGFLQRQLDSAYTTDANSAQIQFLTNANAGVVGKSLYQSQTNGKTWFTLAKIRLKDLHSFFDQLPLVKGAFLSLRINTNTVNHSLTYTVSDTHARTSISCASSIINGGTSPIMLASEITPNGLFPFHAAVIAATGGAATDDVYTLSFRNNIGKDTFQTSGVSYSHPTWGAQTRLFVPMYQMSPIDEEKYLSLNRTKRIVYDDIYSYQTNVAANTPFNQLLTNGIPNPTTVVCIPFFSNSANPIGETDLLNYTYPFQSPFTSEPGTTSPLIVLQDFNIQVAGINMFTQNETYDFEQFLNELSSQNAINGNLVNGLTSGLISEKDFYHMYRYYVCDVSRRLPAEDSVPKSISIQGKNLSTKAISIFTFIVFKREITIDLSTGQKLD